MNWFQAVGKDGIYPGIGWFEKGGNANNDPIRGWCLASLIVANREEEELKKGGGSIRSLMSRFKSNI